MDISIRLTPEEKHIAESYAKANSITLEDAFKVALFEKIEDADDLKAYEKAYKEYIDSGKKSISFEDVWKEIIL